MSAESVAIDHYQQQQRLANAAADVAGDAWRQVDPDNITASWGRVSPQVTVAVAGAQQAAAQAADGYLDEALAAQGLSPTAAGSVNPAAFAGIASDGRPLQSLIQQPAIGTLTAIGRGHPVDRAMAMGASALDMIVRTQVADAGRAADQAALVARPAAGGYVRLLVPPSCSRCAILAGRWYRYSAGFSRHPRCRPGRLPAYSLGGTAGWRPDHESARLLRQPKPGRAGPDLRQGRRARDPRRRRHVAGGQCATRDVHRRRA